jgi:hypothetical protein
MYGFGACLQLRFFLNLYNRIKNGASPKPAPPKIMLLLLAQQRLSLSYHIIHGIAKLF